jgi:hypothetical protein
MDPYSRTYNVFISHSWKYDDDYQRLLSMLNSVPSFKWKNYSVPWDDPFARMGKIKLQEEIKHQIKATSIVLVIAGMYVSYREWIQFEINMADFYEKPIIAIYPRGNERLPAALDREDIRKVGWYTPTIINGIISDALGNP